MMTVAYVTYPTVVVGMTYRFFVSAAIPGFDSESHELIARLEAIDVVSIPGLALLLLFVEETDQLMWLHPFYVGAIEPVDEDDDDEEEEEPEDTGEGRVFQMSASS